MHKNFLACLTGKMVDSNWNTCQCTNLYFHFSYKVFGTPLKINNSALVTRKLLTRLKNRDLISSEISSAKWWLQSRSEETKRSQNRKQSHANSKHWCRYNLTVIKLSIYKNNVCLSSNTLLRFHFLRIPCNNMERISDSPPKLYIL